MSEPERDRAVGRGLAPAVLNPFFFIKINKHTARGGAPYARGGSYRAGGDGQGAIFLSIYARFMRDVVTLQSKVIASCPLQHHPELNEH